MWLIAVLAVAARLPFVTQPLGSDEGGFLMVASQWAPGTSLYGSYWVDRPPLLIDFFAISDQLGGTVALRLLGAALVGLSVVLAGRIGRAAVPDASRGRWTSVMTAGTAAVFLVNPLFGAMEVNGELIAVPLILLSIERILHGHTSASTPGRTGWVVAGAAAAAAVLVKQNEIDALLLIAFLGARTARAHGAALAGRQLALATTGALLVTLAVLSHAVTRGTTLPGLWEAVVTFRLDASAVISSSASPATSVRLSHALLSLVASGAPLIVLLLLSRMRRGPTVTGPDLRLPALVLLGWELVSVLGGGSYWLHYLLVLVPGLVLAVAAICAGVQEAPHRGPGGWLRADVAALHVALTWALVVSSVALGVLGAQSSRSHGRDPIITYLSAHQQPGDTALIAYGHPDILRASGLSSPYPQLWSLPVRVRDPQLAQLTAVMTSSSRPDWIVTTGASLASWGLDATTAQAALAAHYTLVADVDGDHVYHQLIPQHPPS